jgi:hypothetical protein
VIRLRRALAVFVTSILLATPLSASAAPADPTPAPVISGVATVGQSLTAQLPPWTPEPVAVSFAWYRSGTPIGGATASSYLLTAADAGKKVSVRATGSAADGSSVTVRSTSLTVGKAFSKSPTPTVTGSFTVGSTLTAKLGTWTTGTTFAYRWLRDGAAISGATKSTYTVKGSDAHRNLSVTVTGKKSGHTSVARTSAATRAGLRMTRTPIPTVAGTPTVGETLSASAGTWSPATVELQYQWFRSGTEISGATAQTLDLTDADAGKTIRVEVRGSAQGYTAVTRSSEGRLVGRRLESASPVIVGVPSVRAKLKVDAGEWGPASVKLSYQWRRDGKAISGSTSSSYTVGSSDVGKLLSVTVKGTKSGFTSESRSATAVRAGRLFGETPIPTISGTPETGSTMTVHTGTWRPGPVTFTYQWKRDGEPIVGATAASWVVTASGDAVGEISVAVTGTRTGYLPHTVESNEVGEDFYSIVLIPDTQYSASRHPELMTKQMEYLADNAEQLNLQMVLHEGDVVNCTACSSQWTSAYKAINKIDGVVPFVIAAGNHDMLDYRESIGHPAGDEKTGHELLAGEVKSDFKSGSDAKLGSGMLGLRTANFNAMIKKFDHYDVDGYFKRGDYLNTYSLFESGGTKYVVLNLQFGAPDAVLTWAGGVASKYWSRHVIVLTHDYLGHTGLVRKANNTVVDLALPSSLNATLNDPDEIWRQLIRKHKNIQFVFSGHVISVSPGLPYATSRATATTDAGSKVYEMLANFQMYNSGDGYLRILKFYPDDRRIDVTTYSPAHDEFLTNPANQFSLTGVNMAPYTR